MKRCAAFFIAFLVCWSSLAQANLTLANLKFAYFGPSASTMVQSCGGFSYINGSSKSADGGVTNNVIDTTGSSLYVLTVGSSAANAGTITIGTRNLANTFIAGNIVASGTTGFSNQQFYCISPLTDPNTEFYAVSSTGGRVGLVAQAWGCTGTPVFQGQIGNGATSGVTIQGGTLTPLGTNLFVSSATYDIANSGGYTAPTLENFTFSSDAVPAQGSTNSSSALSITWTNGSSSAKAVSTMMFGSTNCGGGTTFPTGADVDWRVDNNLLDSSGNGNTASMTSGSATYTADETGALLRAFDFTSGGRVFAAGSSSIANYTSSDFTISIWVMVTASSFTGNPIVVSKSGAFASTGYFEEFVVDPGGSSALGYFQVILNTGSTGQIIRTPDATFSVGTWYNIVFVRSGTVGKIYVNSVDSTQAGGPTLANLASDSHNLQVGDYSLSGFPFVGILPQATSWPRALNTTEIGNIFSGGSL